MSRPTNHHYLPVFYLRQWCNANGKVVRYHRPYKDVIASPIAPDNTGCEPGLYTLHGYPPEKRRRSKLTASSTPPLCTGASGSLGGTSRCALPLETSGTPPAPDRNRTQGAFPASGALTDFSTDQAIWLSSNPVHVSPWSTVVSTALSPSYPTLGLIPLSSRNSPFTRRRPHFYRGFAPYQPCFVSQHTREPGGEDVKPAADFSEGGAEHGRAGAEVSIGRPIAPEFCIESPESSGALGIIAKPSVEAPDQVGEASFVVMCCRRFVGPSYMWGGRSKSQSEPLGGAAD